MENIFFDLKQLKYLGVGAIIGKTVRIRHPEKVIIGDYSIIDDFTYISCELEVGRHCHIAPNVTMSGGAGKVRLGDLAGIAAGSSLHAGSSDYVRASLDLPSVPAEMRFGGVIGDIMLSDHVLLGAHTCVLPGVTLPVGVATAAFTLLKKQLYEEWTLYGGEDGHKLCARRHAALDQQLMKYPELLGTQTSQI